MRFVAIVAACAATGALTAAARTETRSMSAGSLSGRILVLENGQPVPVRRAMVTLRGSLVQTSGATTHTDTDGRYRFDTVPAGTVRLVVAKPGFVMPGIGSFRTAGWPAEIADGRTSTLDLTMLPGAAIEGRVLDETGQPVRDIIVSAARFSYSLNGRHPEAVAQTITDGTGHYRLHTLAAGEYYVYAMPNPRGEPQLVWLPEGPPLGVALTYYPGTSRGDQAQSVFIAAGQEVTDLDVVLTSVSLAEVSGQVLTSSGRKAERFSVRLQAVGGPVGQVGGGIPGGTNLFFYRAVPPGDYWFSAVSADEDGGQEVVILRLSVAGRDVTGLTLQTAPGREVAGRVEVDAGAAPLPPGLFVVAHETALELPTPHEATAPGPAPVAPTGAFTFDWLFGPRLLRVAGLPPGWAVSGVQLGDADISDTPVDFQAVNSGNPRVRVTNITGEMTGTARDASGRPVAGLPVVVFSANEARWGALSRWVRAVETDLDGRFAVGDLIPDRYHVVAVRQLDSGAWMDPDVLRRLATGTPISVVAGASTQADVTVGGT